MFDFGNSISVPRYAGLMKQVCVNGVCFTTTIDPENIFEETCSQEMPGSYWTGCVRHCLVINFFSFFKTHLLENKSKTLRT